MLWVVASMKRTHFEFSRVAVNVLWRCANQELELGTSAPRFGINSPRRSDLLPVICNDETGYQPPKSTTILAMRDQDLTCQNCGPSSNLRLHAHFPEVDELPELRCLECVACGEVVLVERVTSITQPHLVY